MTTQTSTASITDAMRELLEAAEHLLGASDEDDARQAKAELETAIARARKVLP